jgi:predicted amidohydrolase
MQTLKIALLHAEILHSRPRENRGAIVSMASEAADRGARILVAPEMCLSGYVFHDRSAISPFVETVEGPSAQIFSRLAKEKAVFFVAGFAENDPATGVYYNTAFAWGPDGKLAARYRKINAESRWACPGPAVQDNVFDTPWGKCGLLVCSDTYHSLPSRQAALRGARILLVPANWPPSGAFPENIWRFRAMENGLWLAAANRTGNEAGLDCRECGSYVYGPRGAQAASRTSTASILVECEIPLSPSGEAADAERREEILASRRPWLNHRIYANLSFFRDITEGFGLPLPGPAALHLLAPGKGASPLEFLEAGADKLAEGAVAVLPLRDEWTGEDLERLGRLAGDKGVTVFTGEDDGEDRVHVVVRPDGAERLPLPFDRPEPPVHLGPLAAEPVRAVDLIHPETAIAAAKRGVDILLAVEAGLGPDDLFCASMRTVDQAACAVCAPEGAGCWLIPEGHVPGTGRTVGEGEWLSCSVDSRLCRQKRFQDRMDFDLLFAGSNVGPWE